MRRIFVCIAFAALAAPALAQTGANPVMEHYRAYAAAFEAGDFIAAETEAEAALAASQARDGDGGRTAVLALNLATVRLRASDAAGAIEPAQLSLRLADGRSVDPTFAALILGRAELAAGSAGGADRLRSIFTSSMLPQVPAEEVYPAASQLGVWAYRERDFATAELSWSTAAEYASGAPGGAQFGLGTAQAWRAASIFFDEIGPNGRNRLSRDRAADAYRTAGQAVETLRPLSLAYTSDQGITLGVKAFAEALTVRQIIRSRILSTGDELPADIEAQGDVAGYVELAAPANLLVPPCHVRFQHDDTLRFPWNAGGRIGAVAMLMRVDDAEAVSAEVISEIGHDAFSEAVLRARWRVERREESAPNCRMPRSVVMPVTFYVRS